MTTIMIITLTIAVKIFTALQCYKFTVTAAAEICGF